MHSAHRAAAVLAVLAVSAVPASGPVLAQGDGGPAFNSEDIVTSTVRVVAYDPLGRRRWGTGWVISGTDDVRRAGNAIIITTNTTVQGAERVRVIPAGENAELPARIRSTKPETKTDFDVAFLEVKGIVAPHFKVAGTIPDSARPVYASGYSFISDRNEAARWARKASVQSGTLSKIFSGGMIQASQAPVDQIEHNSPLDDGYSGGPLLDRCGRVIGVNTKDGGFLRLGDEASIALSRGSVFALAANELISVAGQEGVPVEVVPGGPCAAEAAAAVPPPVAVTPPPPPPPEPPPSMMQNTGDFFRSNPLYLALVVLVALAALGLGLWLLMLGKKPVPAPVAPPVEPARPAGPGTSVQPPAPVVELTGRGPDGEPLNFRFSAEELAHGGITIGSDRSKAGASVDNRADYKVSRQHARIGFDGRNFTIEDMKSTNGTKVGGVRLEPHQPRTLMSGDEIELADVKLRIGVR